MVFDLRRALLAKEEKDTARLLDFEFRQRARTFRLLAATLDLDPAVLVREIALHDDPAILDALANDLPMSREELGHHYARCRADAYAQLVGELGDPTPHRFG
ncbi:hypothetical protein GGC65_003274 [Sphingopyxis sp. OAS728]|uniref:hypothetical protein n=1 Tax=Sphingopyxis sp. OAS728 TaxID=2663823 RepID=UPI00178953EC|nr:hypothetical protein [Sphingopyxis sp. OAS728]MBE1528818.1 hypothetical protein [Sphingopyxis sp. OAS728]